MTHDLDERPFLLLSIRADEAAAADEHAAIARFGGLTESELHLFGLHSQPLGELDLAGWAGVILGGGPYNVSDPADAKSADQRRAEADLANLLARVLDQDFPFLGCCYGIGALGSQIGATVDRSFGEPIGAVTVTLTEAGRDDPLLADLPASFDAFVGHKEAISALPASATVLATSATCPVQAFRVGRNVYATQFHPELDVPGLHTRIDVYKHAGYFDPESADSLKASAGASNVAHPPTLLRNFVRQARSLARMAQ
ncbi:MAG: glutamine amidotransferase [Jatrophihabitantaceae bacterium]